MKMRKTGCFVLFLLAESAMCMGADSVDALRRENDDLRAENARLRVELERLAPDRVTTKNAAVQGQFCTVSELVATCPADLVARIQPVFVKKSSNSKKRPSLNPIIVQEYNAWIRAAFRGKHIIVTGKCTLNSSGEAAEIVDNAPAGRYRGTVVTFALNDKGKALMRDLQPGAPITITMRGIITGGGGWLEPWGFIGDDEYPTLRFVVGEAEIERVVKR
jgi:hypothetical protein